MSRPTALSIVLLLLAGCGDTQQAPSPAAPPTPGNERAGPEAGGADLVGEARDRETLIKRPADWPSAAKRRLEADHAPTPFTAEQIRAGCPSGLRTSYLMEGGGRKMVQLWTFTNADAQGVDLTTDAKTEDGNTLGKPRTRRQEWTSLQRHADYPARFTDIRDETITVPAGTYLCMRYTVTQPDDGKTSVGDFWFAYELPGAPIKWVQSADGVQLQTMELIKREVVAPEMPSSGDPDSPSGQK